MTEFVLIPGAWLGGWVWKKVVPMLGERGHTATCVTLTGMGDRVHLAAEGIGIETAVEDVLNVIKYDDLDDFVLVGHSFAGKVAAAVADRVPGKVRSVLYLDAFRPKRVRTAQGGFADEFPVDGWKIPFSEKILDSIGKDVQGADRKWMLSKATPWPATYSREPITLSMNYDGIRESYIFCTGGGDDVQQVLKEKLDAPHRVIDSGHWPMITKPAELAKAMSQLTES